MPRSFSRRDMLITFDFDAYLRSIANISPQWNLQETTGLVAGAWNTAVPLGRELVINGAAPIAFTGDAPDDWAIVEPVNTEITERGTGQLNAGGGTGAINFYNNGGTGNRPVITQTYSSMTGKTIFYTIVISAYGSGTLELVSNTSEVQFTSVDTFTGTLDVLNQFGNVDIRLEGNGDITVDSISFMQTGIPESSVYPGAEKLNTAGASGTATAANWTAINSAALSNPSVGVLRIERDGVNNAGVTQAVLTAGLRYGWLTQARSDGNATPLALVDNAGAVGWTGTTSTDWQTVDFEHVDTATIVTLLSSTAVDTQYTEWRNISVRPANPLNGDDTATTVGVATGLASMPYARTFDGATSYIDIYSTELNSVFNPDAGTLIAFAKSTTWAAGIDYLINLQVDANNWVSMSRSATNIIASYKAGGTDESVTIASGSPTGWFMVALTWDTDGAGAVKAYYQGVQSGSTQTIAGTLVGNLAATTTVIGALSTTPTNSWLGDGVPPMLANRALTAIEIGDIYQRWGG